MTHSPLPRPGVVLFSVLVIIAILILVGYQFLNLMNAEFAATVASNKVLQSRHLSESGVNYATFILAHPETTGLSGDGASPVIFAPLAYENEQMFHRLPVNGPDGTRGYFSIVSMRDPSDPNAATMGYKFGVQDECSKINLHTLVLTDRDNQAVSVLSRLPNMNQEIADSLLKWIKPSDGTDSGAALKYGTVESLEELLLVPNMTPRLLLGNDRNRNGQIEPDEDDTGGVCDPGLARYLTVHSRELDVDFTGQPRTSIAITQQMDAAAVETMHANLAAVLPPELVQEIIKFQVLGTPPVRRGGGGMQMTNLPQWAKLADGKLNIDYKHAQFNPQALRPIASLFDLVVPANGATWTILQQNPGQGGGGGGGGGSMTISAVSCLLRSDNKDVLRTMLPVLLDKITTRDIVRYGLERPARININTAPQEVIAAYITTDAEQQKVMQFRPTAETDPAQAMLYSTLAWLVTEADVAPSNLRTYEQYFNARSQVYRFQAVGYFDGPGPTTRVEAVVDVNGGRPRILYWRDISILGRGFNFSQNVTLP